MKIFYYHCIGGQKNLLSIILKSNWQKLLIFTQKGQNAFSKNLTINYPVSKIVIHIGFALNKQSTYNMCSFIKIDIVINIIVTG